MSTQRMAVLAMFAAAAFLLMAAVQFPILPAAPFLKYDPSDAVALTAGVVYGPGSGLLVVLIKDLLFLLFRAPSPFGPLADFIAAGTFVATTGWVFRRWRGPFAARLLRAALVGAFARVAVMIPTNFVILSLEFGMAPARVAGLLLPAIVPFNALKAAINAGIALALAEPIVRYLAPRLSGNRHRE